MTKDQAEMNEYFTFQDEKITYLTYTLQVVKRELEKDKEGQKDKLHLLNQVNSAIDYDSVVKHNPYAS